MPAFLLKAKLWEGLSALTLHLLQFNPLLLDVPLDGVCFAQHAFNIGADAAIRIGIFFVFAILLIVRMMLSKLAVGVKA